MTNGTIRSPEAESNNNPKISETELINGN